MSNCAFCNQEIEVVDKVFRKDQCPHCGEDLHCCKQCVYFELGRENDCREPRAERVVENERANFCDYFEFAGGDGVEESMDNAKKQLDDLFK